MRRRSRGAVPAPLRAPSPAARRGSGAFPDGRLPTPGPGPDDAATVAAMSDQQTDLSDLIGHVCDGVKAEAEYVEQRASILRAAADSGSVTQQDLEQLGQECAGLVQKAQAGAHQLTTAGVQDWVYSVKACESVVAYAHEAMGHALAAAQTEYQVEVHMNLDSCVHSLQNAVHAIRGA